MEIGGVDEGSQMRQFLLQVNIIARNFVRSHSDMAMSHVAAYQKSYKRAAQDVAILVEEKGESTTTKIKILSSANRTFSKYSHLLRQESCQ